MDELLGGGLWVGDNVVWVTDDPNATAALVRAFLGVGARPRHLRVGAERSVAELPTGVERVVVDPSLGPAALESALLDGQLEAGDRIVVEGLEDLVAHWGAAATVELYRRTCPRLFSRGAIACWMADAAVGPSVIESVARVAQCHVEVRAGRVRVVKAEGRPRRLRGSLADFAIDEGQPVVSREQAMGRLGEGLRRIRRERNLTQAQLAALGGVTPAAVSQAETGRRGLSLDTIVQMCEALAIGVDDMLETSRPPDPLLARHDTAGGSRAEVALFADATAGPRTYLLKLGPDESRPPPFVHKGPELVLGVSGLVLVDLGDSSPVLRAGDALRVTGVPIRLISNLEERESAVFWQAIDAGVNGGMAGERSFPGPLESPS